MGDTRILDVKTSTRVDMIDITTLVRSAVRESNVEEGIVCVFCPHTTAGITLQENSDPVVKSDMMNHLAALVPRDAGFEHSEDNQDAHIKASLVGGSITLIVEKGRPVFGPWQALFFCEFDGPRSRKLHVQIASLHQ